MCNVLKLKHWLGNVLNGASQRTDTWGEKIKGNGGGRFWRRVKEGRAEVQDDGWKRTGKDWADLCSLWIRGSCGGVWRGLKHHSTGVKSSQRLLLAHWTKKRDILIMGYLALLEFECLVFEVTSCRVVWCRLPGLMPGQRGLKTGRRNVKTQAERNEWLWTWRNITASEVMSLLNFGQGEARIFNGEFLRIFPLKEMETCEGLDRRCENQTGEVCACCCHP